MKVIFRTRVSYDGFKTTVYSEKRLTTKEQKDLYQVLYNRITEYGLYDVPSFEQFTNNMEVKVKKYPIFKSGKDE